MFAGKLIDVALQVLGRNLVKRFLVRPLRRGQKLSIPLVCTISFTYSETLCLTVSCGFGMPS